MNEENNLGCENPCKLVTKELKKFGFECASFVDRFVSKEPYIRAKYSLATDKENISPLGWAQLLIGIIKEKIRCPVKFLYVVKFTRDADRKANFIIDMQMIFRSPKYLQYDFFPADDLQNMVKQFEIIEKAGKLINTTYRFEISGEFINYGPRRTSKETEVILDEEDKISLQKEKTPAATRAPETTETRPAPKSASAPAATSNVLKEQ